jgi:hypothetical protein
MLDVNPKGNCTASIVVFPDTVLTTANSLRMTEQLLLLILKVPRKEGEATKIPHEKMNILEVALLGCNISSTLLYP